MGRIYQETRRKLLLAVRWGIKEWPSWNLVNRKGWYKKSYIRHTDGKTSLTIKMHLAIRNYKGFLIDQVKMRKIVKDWLTTNGKSQSLGVCVHVILCFSDMFVLLWDDRQCQQEMIHSENEVGFMYASSVSSIQIADTLIMINNSSQGNFSYLAYQPKIQKAVSVIFVLHLSY